MGRRTMHTLVTAAALVVAMTACGSDDDADPTSAPTSPTSAATTGGSSTPTAAPFGSPTPATEHFIGFTCAGDEDSAADLLVTTNSNGDPTGLLHYAPSGKPRGVAVVLAHQSNMSPCGWDEWARTLARQGYQVVVPDVTTDPLQMLAVADRTARSEGGKKVVLLGASMGGTYVLAAAPDLKPDAVIALSAPDEHEGVDALGPIRKIRAPILLAAATGDTSFRDSLKALAKAAPDETTVVLERGTDDHGVEFLERGGPVRAAVRTMLASVG